MTFLRHLRDDELGLSSNVKGEVMDAMPLYLVLERTVGMDSVAARYLIPPIGKTELAALSPIAQND